MRDTSEPCFPKKAPPCWKIKRAIRLNDVSGWLLACALRNLTHQEFSDEQGIIPDPAQRAACDAQRTFRRRRSRHFRRADHAARGRLRSVHEDQEFPLAYVRPAFP